MSPSERNLHDDVTLYVDNRLSTAARREFEDHLATCAHCQQTLAYIKQLHTDLKGIPTPELPPMFNAKVLAEARHRSEEKFTPRRPWVMAWSGVTAVAVVGLVLVTTQDYWRGTHPVPHQIQITLQEEAKSFPVMNEMKDQLKESARQKIAVGSATGRGIALQDVPALKSVRQVPLMSMSDQLATPAAPSPVSATADGAIPMAAAPAMPQLASRGIAAKSLNGEMQQNGNPIPLPIQVLVGPLQSRQVLKKVFPKYPTVESAKGASGTIRVYITVNAQGIVNPNPRITLSSGFADLDQAALKAAQQWKFNPSDSAQQWGILTFNFSL